MNKIVLLILCLSVQNIWSQEWYRDAILKGKEYPRYSQPVNLKIETLVREIEKNSYFMVLVYRSSVQNSDIVIFLDRRARRQLSFYVECQQSGGVDIEYLVGNSQRSGNMSVDFIRMGMEQKMVFIIDREIEFSIEEKDEDILTILTDDYIKTSIGISKTTKAIGDGAKAVGTGIIDGVKYLWNSF